MIPVLVEHATQRLALVRSLIGGRLQPAMSVLAGLELQPATNLPLGLEALLEVVQVRWDSQ